MPLFRKYKELILYVFFGGLTTVVNWVGYWLLADLLHVPYLWATAIAQIAAILFAYVTNRIWVFHSKAKGLGPVLGEMVRFFGCRGVSFVLDLLCMRVGVGVYSASPNRNVDAGPFLGYNKVLHYVNIGGLAYGAQKSCRLRGV